MTPEEFATRMAEIRDKDGLEDPEVAHVEMDELMASLLFKLGYEDGIRIFIEQEKWYA